MRALAWQSIIISHSDKFCFNSPHKISNLFSASYQFWQAYKNPFEPLVKKGYNAYLKANKQDKGIASYSYVVDLFITYFESLEGS